MPYTQRDRVDAYYFLRQLRNRASADRRPFAVLTLDYWIGDLQRAIARVHAYGETPATES